MSLRVGYRHQLSNFDGRVRAMLSQVTDDLERANRALMSGDVVEAAAVVDLDKGMDAIQPRIEAELQAVIARQSPIGSDLRFLVTVLRTVPELERCHDLVCHIARRVGRHGKLPEVVRDELEVIGETTLQMWSSASLAWAMADPAAAALLESLDQDLDDLVKGMPRSITRAGVAALDVQTAMDLMLTGRFYERLGDHAVHLCERIRWWASGV